MNQNKQGDFQICVSAPLILEAKSRDDPKILFDFGLEKQAEHFEGQNNY